MSKIAVHLDPVTHNIAGIWMNIKGKPTSYYVGSEYERQIGERDITSQIRGPWDGFVERLSEKTPSNIWWEASDREGNESLQEAYTRLVKSDN